MAPQDSKDSTHPNYAPVVTLGAGSNPVNGLDSTVFPGLTANSPPLLARTC